MTTLRSPVPDEAGELVKSRFLDFLKNFKFYSQNETILDYTGQILTMIEANKSTVFVDFQHIMQYDNELAEAIELEYYRFDVWLRAAVSEIVHLANENYIYDVDKGQREFFVALFNMLKVEKVRSMRALKIGKLISICGTVTRSTEVRPELLYGTFICNKCGTLYANIEQQFQYTQPQICRTAQCQSNSFQLILDKSTFIDWQRLKVQENSDEIPPGSMPRSIEIICRNEIVETVKAGDKVIFTGMIAVASDRSGLARVGDPTTSSRTSAATNNDTGMTGLKALGVREMTYRMFFVASTAIRTDLYTGQGGSNNSLYERVVNFHSSGDFDNYALSGIQSNPGGGGNGGMVWSDEELQEIKQIYSTPGLYTRLVDSLCPDIYGHMDIKRGILLMLCGGVHKKTPEGISLRGDVNICVIGDPSCAKSQFLKFIHDFWPRSVYTSGKSSSAAGLTASVVRDAETGEFCVEAGALMLADNGICCIDEFDKMDPGDQVAIHEAMEQQTISITKAGIQATLNARTSILAAANPVHGRYDRTKTLKANVAISAPIMSRFDLFFILLDECIPEIDEHIARHIIGSYRNKSKQIPSQHDEADEDTHRSQSQDDVTMIYEHPPLSPPASPNNSILNETLPYGVTSTQHEVPRGNDAGRPRRAAVAPAPLFSSDQLRRYIQYARTISPVMTPNSRKVLVECYRLLRQNDHLGKNKTSYRITVRQLESLVRLSEAVARVHLSEKIEEQYVREAYRLLQKSIISVEAEDVELNINQEEDDAILPEPEFLRKRSYEDLTEHRESTATPTFESIAPEVEEKKSSSNSNKKQKSYLAADEYNRITRMLAHKLQHLENSWNSDADTVYPGCPWKELVEWYMTEIHDELTTTELFDIKKKSVNQVIKRMIKHEGSVVELIPSTQETGVAVRNDEKYLKLHPSYVM